MNCLDNGVRVLQTKQIFTNTISPIDRSLYVLFNNIVIAYSSIHSEGNTLLFIACRNCSRKYLTILIKTF